MSLVDNKGLGKPDKFTGTEENSFLKYPITRLEAFVCSVYVEVEEALPWAEELEQAITDNDIESAWAETDPSH